VLTSRDTGVLAAIGVDHVNVWRKPIVAILSTGDEIIAPGNPMQPAKVYDSNAQVLADAVRELGGEPRRLGSSRTISLPCASDYIMRLNSPTSYSCREGPARVRETCLIVLFPN
jgi:hypothetical protein